MLGRIIFLFILVSTGFVQASECLLNEALKNPELSANAKFWEELSELNAKGKLSDQQIKSLIEKHGGSFSATPAQINPAFQKSAKLDIQNRASKEIKGLPANLKGKVDEFLDIALKPGGMQELYNNPGRWHLEHIKAEGPNTYTIRLNEGYRVLFDYKDGELQVRRVNKGQIHSI